MIVKRAGTYLVVDRSCGVTDRGNNHRRMAGLLAHAPATASEADGDTR